MPDPDARSAARYRTWRIVENTLASIILVASAWYLWVHRQELVATLDVSPRQLSYLVLGVLLSWFVNAVQNYVLYRAEGLGIGFGENLVLTVCAAFGNYLPMRIGTIVRLRYLKAVHGLGYVRSGSIFGIRIVLVVAATGLLGLVGTIGAWLEEGPFSPELFATFMAMLTMSAAAFFHPAPARSTSGRIARLWNEFLAGFQALRTRPAISLTVLALFLVQYLLLGARFFVSMQAVQSHASWPVLVLFGALAGLTSFVAITPGGLGLREALMGYVTLSTGADFDTGVFAGTVDRTVSLALVATLGTASYVYVWWRLQRFTRDGASAAGLDQGAP
jgi:uncharacterized membrane protein YbhN (UPF0104 family)